jgi:hypothetical protein
MTSATTCSRGSGRFTRDAPPNYRGIFHLIGDARAHERINSDGNEWETLLALVPEAKAILPEDTGQLRAMERVGWVPDISRRLTGPYGDRERCGNVLYIS